MRWPSLVLVSALLVACKAPPHVPEASGAPELASYAAAHPRELERLANAYEEGRASALQRCSDAVELVDAVKDPIDTELWESIVKAAERSGSNRLFAARLRENASFERVFHENDDDIPKRTLGATRYLADQKGCAGASEVAGAAAAGLKRAAEKRVEERLREVSEAHLLLRSRVEAVGKANVAPLTKQADAIALASYLVTYELPRLAHERQRLLSESDRVRETLTGAIQAEKTAQGVTGASDAERKASAERQRDLEASLGLLDGLSKKHAGHEGEVVENELRDTRDGCREILDAVRTAIRKRSPK